MTGPPDDPAREIEALDEFSCPACGARAEWSPGRQGLVCPYCGTNAPGELDLETGALREADLVRALRELPDEERGWLADVRSVRCRACDAVSVFEPGRVGQRCEFCGSPELVSYEEVRAPIRPEGVLPFSVDRAAAQDALRSWLRGRWLAPRGLARHAVTNAARGVYVPMWTFDARARCRWSADSGTYYYERRTVRGPDGKRRTERVRRVRWRPVTGELDHAFDDEPVPGTRGLDADLLARIAPFPLDRAVRYDTAFLSGFVVEHYRVVLLEAAQQAREAMDATLRSLAARAVPGDTMRNLRISPRYAGQTFKLVLVPVWLLPYVHRGKSYQVLINGSTGRAAGRAPKSAWKIAALVLAGAALLAAAWAASHWL